MKTMTSSALLLILLLTAATVFADSPPANTIPIISMKTGIESTCDDITMDALLRLLWQNFDGIWISGTFYNNGSAVVPATLCDSTGAYMLVAPTRLAALNFWPDLRRGRYTLAAISDSNAFIQPTSDFSAIADTFTAAQVGDLIDTRCQQLKDSLDLHDCVWYLDVFNESSAWQLNRMLNTTYDYDQYFPRMYAQDTMMNQTLPDGTFS